MVAKASWWKFVILKVSDALHLLLHVRPERHYRLDFMYHPLIQKKNHVSLMSNPKMSGSHGSRLFTPALGVFM